MSCGRLTPHASRLTPHASRLTPHASRRALTRTKTICPPFGGHNDWIILYSVNKHANKQGVKTETLCYINGSVNSLHKFINNEQYNAKQQTHVTNFFGSFVIPMK